MSTLAASFGVRGPSPAEVVETLLQRLPREADDVGEVWFEGDVALGVARHAWQTADELEGSLLVARSDRTVVISDATLYGAPAIDMTAGPGIVRRSPAAAMLQAWERWGTDCVRHFRGDFAFILWDRVEHRAVLGRDVTGRRVLYVRPGPGQSLAVASSSRALAHAVEPAAQPNLHVVAAAASGLPGGALESGYLGIRPVPAGATMSWSRRDGLQLLAQWEPPPFQVASGERMEDAAARLRELLTVAVRERIEGTPSTIWLSGGADSTALFAVAMASRQPNEKLPPIHPVSVSYPEGDSGREDHHIIALTERWKSPVSWIDSETIPLFEGSEERASRRDDPFAHTFAPVTAALSRATRAAGARVTLDGYGGDALFAVSRGWVADLLLAGHFRSWWRAVQPAANANWISALRWGLLPALPESAWRVFDLMRPRPLQRAFQYPIAGWLTPSIQRDLRELGWSGFDIKRRLWEGPAAFESRSGLTGPHFARALAATRENTVPYGVEVRSPFMDVRVIELAASRPVTERAAIGNSKRLLKAAMAEIIPESVLAPRPSKTGLAAGYLHRRYANELTRRLREAFNRSSSLADNHLVDPIGVAKAAERYESSAEHMIGVALHLTLEAEYWLRGHSEFIHSPKVAY